MIFTLKKILSNFYSLKFQRKEIGFLCIFYFKKQRDKVTNVLKKDIEPDQNLTPVHEHHRLLFFSSL